MKAADLEREIANTAGEFSLQLRKLSTAIDADLSKVMRVTAFRAFRGIVKRSPVDTGAYRASHGISVTKPSGEEGIVKRVKGEKIPSSVSMAKVRSFAWTVKDKAIWMFNNLPYAAKIEDGYSNPNNKPRMVKGKDRQSVVKAPEGVYRIALKEISTFIKQELSKFKEFGNR